MSAHVNASQRNINAVNGIVAKAIARDLAWRFPGRVRTEDCGRLFFQEERSVLMRKELLVDGLHPNLEGSRVLAECMRGAFARWRVELIRDNSHVP